MSDKRDRAVMVSTLAQEESEHRRRKHNRKREAACGECQGFTLFAMHDLLVAINTPRRYLVDGRELRTRIDPPEAAS